MISIWKLEIHDPSALNLAYLVVHNIIQIEIHLFNLIAAIDWIDHIVLVSKGVMLKVHLLYFSVSSTKAIPKVLLHKLNVHLRIPLPHTDLAIYGVTKNYHRTRDSDTWGNISVLNESLQNLPGTKMKNCIVTDYSIFLENHTWESLWHREHTSCSHSKYISFFSLELNKIYSISWC